MKIMSPLGGSKWQGSPHSHDDKLEIKAKYFSQEHPLPYGEGQFNTLLPVHKNCRLTIG